MTSSMPSKTLCASCDKNGVGIFKCEGCTQVFCRKHSIEHRDILSHQLDEIVLEHDTLQQTIVEHEDKQNRCHPLMEQINRWETDAIERIRKTAEEARQQVNKLITTQTEIVSKKLHDLAERLRKARTDDDYVETDLEIWVTKLEKWKRYVTAVFHSINIHEDPTNVLIAKMYISSTVQQLDFEEQFGEISGDINIEDNGHVIKHGSSKKEYFGYGWQTDDYMNNPDSGCKTRQNSKDLQGETMLKLKLLIDCDNRKIGYFNEQTKNTHEMTVNISKCPFPWQLEFYLFDIDDRVEILSSSQEF
ncbi:unnamed protein product [Rotaria sordida]|uniref:B box-type domain-containing protein n=2 Tax=Rotaria sordida TaxID=392033 RepID=A0A819DNC1_9BILA|nr:unnamed protein product [Rotaria sordida]